MKSECCRNRNPSRVQAKWSG